MAKNLFLPTSLLVGTIIGAGIFSLPFIFTKAGIGISLAYLAFLTAIAAIIHLMYADIIIRTAEDHHHRFPGYAKMYLGKNIGLFANFVIFSALFLTLTIYLVLSASFMNLLAPEMPQMAKIILFWSLGSMAVFLTIKKAAVFESATTVITVAMVFLIFIFGFFAGPEKLFSLSFAHPAMIFLPFGPILFSLLGEAAIPACVVYCRKENLEPKKVKKIITLGTIIPALFYLIFVFGILGLSGNVTEDAVSGLIGHAPNIILVALGIMGFVSLWDSYSAIGTEIKKTLEYEWKIPQLTVNSIIILLPLILYFFGLKNFLELVSLVGGILYGFWGLLVVLTWQETVKKHPNEKTVFKKLNPAIPTLLIFIFIAGIIYHVVYFIN